MPIATLSRTLAASVLFFAYAATADVTGELIGRASTTSFVEAPPATVITSARKLEQFLKPFRLGSHFSEDAPYKRKIDFPRERVLVLKSDMRSIRLEIGQVTEFRDHIEIEHRQIHPRDPAPAVIHTHLQIDVVSSDPRPITLRLTRKTEK